MLILVLTVFTIFWPVLGAVILAFIDKEGTAFEEISGSIFTVLCYLWPIILIIKLKKKYYDS